MDGLAARDAPDEVAAEVAVVPSPRLDAQRLFDTYYLQLVRFAMRLVDDQHSAEDVVQDVFARLLQRPEQHLDDAEHYLRRAVLNACRSALRRRRVARLFWARSEPAGADDPADARALRGADQQRMLAAISRLPQRQREVVVLRYYEDLAVGRIADILTISPNAASAALSRALRTLASTLEAPDAG